MGREEWGRGGQGGMGEVGTVEGGERSAGKNGGEVGRVKWGEVGREE